MVEVKLQSVHMRVRRIPASDTMRWRPIGLLFLAAIILLAPMLRAQPAPTCEQWNTEEFFRVATVDDVTVCLVAGADVAARDEDEITPLHWATWISEHPAVVDALVAARADLKGRNGTGDTPCTMRPPTQFGSSIEQITLDQCDTAIHAGKSEATVGVNE